MYVATLNACFMFAPSNQTFLIMKKILLAAAIWASFFGTSVAQELPQPSPKGEISQMVGLTEVEIEYSRPSMKGRKIFGDLVPFGEMWRTGANGSTIIEFDTDVMVQGTLVKKGNYALFTLPNQSEWEIILNSNTELWGVDGMKAEENVASFKVKPTTCPTTESFTISFDNVKEDACEVSLMWETTKVSFTIAVDVDAASMANIDKAIKDAEGSFRVYNNAARYYLEHNKDLKKALEYAQKSTSMSEKFWNLKVLSEVQAANGLYKEALATAEKSLALATEAKYDAYIKMNQENIAKWKPLATPAKGKK